MFNKLEDIIKKSQGNVLAICLDNNLIEKFNKNNKVNLYSIDSNKSSGLRKQNKKINNKGKTIDIKHLRKYIKKNSVNILICNMNEMFKYYKYFIKDSIYLNNNKIYIYSTNEIDKDFIVKKYRRYNVNIDVNNYKNGFIIIIDNSKGKNNFVKDKVYFIKDTLYNLAEFIGNILVS